MVDLIKTFCETYNYGFRSNYSGRGILGRSCVCIICDDISYTLMKLAKFLFDNGVDDVESALGIPSLDSMDMQLVLYFPNVEV